MSKRILALALFAVMVLSLVPMAQAAAYPVNNVFRAGITNQAQTVTQSADKSAISTGDKNITTSSNNSVNVIALVAAFKDLYKTNQSYYTNNVARYDVWVDLAVAIGVTATNDVNFTIDGKTVIVTGGAAAGEADDQLLWNFNDTVTPPATNPTTANAAAVTAATAAKAASAAADTAANASGTATTGAAALADTAMGTVVTSAGGTTATRGIAATAKTATAAALAAASGVITPAGTADTDVGAAQSAVGLINITTPGTTVTDAQTAANTAKVNADSAKLLADTAKARADAAKAAVDLFKTIADADGTLNGIQLAEIDDAVAKAADAAVKAADAAVKAADTAAKAQSLVDAVKAVADAIAGYTAPSDFPAILAAAKDALDYSKITVNGTTIKNEYLNSSSLRMVNDGNDNWTLYYRLKIAEFDANDSASLSADYEINSWLKNVGGYQTTKIRVTYTNSGESDKPIKPLYLKPVRKGTEGVYNIYVVNGVVFIDYAQDIGGADYLYRTYDGTTYKSGAVYAAIPVGFKFYEDAAATVRIPSYGKYAYVVPSTNTDDTPVSENNSRFFVSIGEGNALADTTTGHLQGLAGPYQIRYIGYADTIDNRADAPFIIPPASAKDTRGRVTNGDDKVLGVWLPNTYGTKTAYADLDTVAERTGVNASAMTESTNRTMKVAIEDENYRYRTGDIKVVFRPLARNLITTAVIVERYLTIAVGEKVTLTIESASATTFDNIKLSEVSSTKSHVYIDGMDVTGISVGTSQIQVSASSKVIDQITVNVVATKETAAAEVVVTNQWRVIARKLNIRTGPGTSYGKAGTLAMNQVVAGTDTGTGWVEIGAGQYVSKQYVVPVTGSATGIGTYTISASSLNVRSGPGSSYAKTGSVTRGTIVEVIAIQNGWAQLASGGWVSTTYLK